MQKDTAKNRVNLKPEKNEKFLYVKRGDKFEKIGTTVELDNVPIWHSSEIFPQPGLWLVMHETHSVSSSHIAGQNDIIGSFLTMGRAFASKEAIVDVLSESKNLSLNDTAARICKLLAEGESKQRETKIR